MNIYEFKSEDAYGIARHLGIQTKQFGDELTFKICPYCRGGESDKKTFSINLKTGVFNCFRSSCGAHGNMITLSKDFNYSLGTQVDEYYKPRKRYKKFVHKEKIIPKEPAIKYLESRGISEKIAKKYEITSRNDNEDILVFPFLDEKGEMCFIKYRDTKFDKAKGGNKEWCEKGGKPILFGMKQCDDSFDTLIVNEGQCFRGDAEIFTPEGWLKLENYSGQKVLQVNEDLSAEFVKPRAYVTKRHTGKMVDVSIGGNYFSSTTDEHNIVFSLNGKLKKKKAIEKISYEGKIPTCINFDSGTSRATDDEIALLLAISADGTVDHRANGDCYARFGLTKQRKVDRLIGILERLGYKYSDSILSHSENKKPYHSICFTVRNKDLAVKFLPYWLVTETTLDQKKAIIEEMVFWDGNHVNNRKQYEYMSIYKHNADVMQAIASTCGYMSTIMTKTSGGNGNFKKGFVYKVSVLLAKHNVSGQCFEKHKKVYEDDVQVFCVTVDSGMILVRQKDRISVSGNCDTLATAEAYNGNINAVSVPTGAKGFSFIPYCWDWLCKWKKIIVFGDHENGTITLLDEFRKRFKNKVFHVSEENYKDCKDANEILLKYGPEQIRKCIEEAVAAPVDNVVDLAEVKDVDVYSLEKIPTGISELDKLLCGGIVFGVVNLITGKAGKGKSTFASQILTHAIDKGYSVFAYSGEMPNFLFKAAIDFQVAGGRNIIGVEGADYTRYSIRNSAREKFTEWYREKCYLYDRSMLADEETDLISTIETMIISKNVRVILLDNLMTLANKVKHKGSNKYDIQSDISNMLEDLARFYNVCIILVAHKRKDSGIDDTDMNDSISGDSDIVNTAGVVIHYDMNKDESTVAEYPRVIAVTKNRVFGRTNYAGWKVKFEEKSKRIYGDADDVDYQLSWDDSDGFINDSSTPFF